MASFWQVPTVCFDLYNLFISEISDRTQHTRHNGKGCLSLDVLPVRKKPCQIIATSHDLGPQKVAEEGKSPSFRKYYNLARSLDFWPHLNRLRLKLCRRSHFFEDYSGCLGPKEKSTQRTPWDVSISIDFTQPHYHNFERNTLPKTNSSPLKIGLPNRKGSYSNHPFSGVNSLLVSGRVAASTNKHQSNIQHKPQHVTGPTPPSLKP